MPTYDYECSKGHEFEAVQRITEEPLKRCQICGAKATRLISQTSFILKGGGWYADGYGKSKDTAGSGSDSSSDGSSASSSDSSSDSSSSTDSSSSGSKTSSSDSGSSGSKGSSSKSA